MSIYLFSYDLRGLQAGVDYDPLYNELKRIEAHRVNDSVWLLNVENSPKEVIEHFKFFTHENDRLWVSQVRRREYWYVNARGGTTSWLKANLFDGEG